MTSRKFGDVRPKFQSVFERKMAAIVNATMSVTVKMTKALCAKVEELEAQLAARDAEIAQLKGEVKVECVWVYLRH